MRTAHRARPRLAMVFAAHALLIAACERIDHTPVTQSAPKWLLPSSPLFDVSAFIAGVDSIPFYNIRGGAFDAQDVVITVRRGGYYVVYLDSMGQSQTIFGGHGQGPGEFMEISPPLAVPSGLGVWDPRNRRISVFSGRKKVSEFQILLPPREQLIGILPGNQVLSTPVNPGAGLTPAVIVGEPRRYTISDPAGKEIRRFGGESELPTPYQHFAFRGESQESDFYLGSTCLPELRDALTPTRLLTVNSHTGMIYSLDSVGSKDLVFAGMPSLISQAQREGLERFISQLRATSGELSVESEQSLRDILGDDGTPLPSVWSAVVPDQDPKANRIWLRRASCFGPEAGPHSWEIVDWAKGAVVGTVDLPSRLRLLSVMGDRILGVERDSLDAEHVVAYRLVKPQD